jgi:hypothetical protein
MLIGRVCEVELQLGNWVFDWKPVLEYFLFILEPYK